jgi:hypothetical protein
MDAIVHTADIQNRDGGVLLVAMLFGLYPFLMSSTRMRATRGHCFSRA